MTPQAPILEFDDVRCSNDHPPLRFRVEPGGCVVVRMNTTDIELAGAIGRIACGIVSPPHGTVRFRGREWAEMPPAEIESARAAIGRLFSGPAWISNLDVEENVLLPSLHHGRRPRAELRAKAVRLARLFGLDDLPAGRVAGVPRRDLQRAQWVRALLGEPILLVLEFPERETQTSDQAAFSAALAEARGRGAGVLWMTDRAPIVGDSESCLTISYRSPIAGATTVESLGRSA